MLALNKLTLCLISLVKATFYEFVLFPLSDGRDLSKSNNANGPVPKRRRGFLVAGDEVCLGYCTEVSAPGLIFGITYSRWVG